MITCFLVTQSSSLSSTSSSLNVRKCLSAVSGLISCFCRYSAVSVLHPHSVLGPESVRDLLHPGRTRALLNRRFYRLLHFDSTLSLLPHTGQHAGFVPTGQTEDKGLVPLILVLRVGSEGHCTKPLRTSCWQIQAHGACIYYMAIKSPPQTQVKQQTIYHAIYCTRSYLMIV